MNKFFKFLIVIFSLAGLGVAGYFVYDKVVVKYFATPEQPKNSKPKVEPKPVEVDKPKSQPPTKTETKQEDQENKKTLSKFTPITKFDLDRAASMKADLPKNHLSFKLDFGNNFVGKENDKYYLGKSNDGLYVYNLNEPNIENHILADKQTKDKILNQEFNIFDKKNRPFIYNLDQIGVYTQKINSVDLRNENIFKRNIRIANGTATILDASAEKTLLITNKHVLKTGIKDDNKQVNFWNIPQSDIFKWYDNGKIHTIEYDDLGILFYVKQTIEKNLSEIKNHDLKAENKDVQTENQINFLKNFLNPYFEVETKFDNKNVDVALFYFKHKKFIEDIKNLADFFSKSPEMNQATIKFSNQDVIDKIKDKFLSNYQNFISFWKSVAQAKSVVISDKLWKIGDSDYDKMVSLFWPKGTPIKNIFKGVYASTIQANTKSVALFFYTTNGPGASGSGVFNAKGELQFLNAFGLLAGKKTSPPVKDNIVSKPGKSKKTEADDEVEFYDNLNTYIAISGGVPFVTEKYNLKKEIEKFYPSKQLKLNQNNLISNITTNTPITVQTN
ncbi:Mhp366/Mhp367 family surface (lipo)protein [Mesomycoplasma bovoculi]|uniref:Uncharacterized protein n=1 Tax=Mesomycoplasma bovoculi M165/69 TaxID=743966 RepID=W5V0D5_9BACT|nr:hypothetical protein [Mesomycoplasma bovoculi]AHH45258.1 hypothetical protein MYB_01240 [Mesomycoplasma bovoculi M165/69]